MLTLSPLSTGLYAPAKNRELINLPLSPQLAKPREPIMLSTPSSMKRKVVDRTLDLSAQSVKKQLTPLSRNRELDVGLLDPPPTPVKERERRMFFSPKKREVDKCLPSSWLKLSSLTSRQIGEVLPIPRRFVQKQLPDTFPAPRLVLENLPSTRLRLADHVVTPEFSHNLTTEFKPIECMKLCINNEKDPHNPTLFTIQAKGVEKAQVDGGNNHRVIHFKLHAQPFGGRFTEAILNVQFVHPGSVHPPPLTPNELIPEAPSTV